MKFRTSKFVLFHFALLAALALPVQLAAQHARYKLIDLETLGGPASFIAPTPNGGPENPGRALTANGVLVGASDTSTPDPNCIFDCFFIHAFRLQGGVLTDLGTLQGSDPNSFSFAAWINSRGWIAGWATIGGIDALSGFPATHAVLWRNGEIVDLVLH